MYMQCMHIYIYIYICSIQSIHLRYILQPPIPRRETGSTVWHKAWHMKNDVKVSRLPPSSPFRAFDKYVASICTWKQLKTGENS